MSRTTRLRVALSSLLLTLLPAGASAQAVHLDQYQSAETAEDGFAISRPSDLGHLRWSAQLHLDYGYNPLVHESDLGDAGTESASVVEHQLVAQASFALGLFDRLVVFGGLPATLVMDGEAVPSVASPDGPGLGDVWLGARGRLYGEDDDAFALGLSLVATFPTAQAANESMEFLGEDGMTFQPEVLAEVRPGLGITITLDLGARLRATDQARFDALRVGHELTYGLGVGFPIVEHDMLTGHVEIYGSSPFDDFGSRQSSPLEAIAGLRVQPIPGLRIGLAAGPGIARGYGTPDFRGVLSVGYAEPAPAAESVPEIEEPTDPDGDGIFGAEDTCPHEPEDVDDFEDADGCPDPDNDSDGVLDVGDGCPLEAEDIDEFEDANGCPNPDNDNDGIANPNDACPVDAEDMDGFADEDGCPELDNDGDSVADPEDECPLEPGPAEANGCPRNVRLDIETGVIRILERVEFASNRDELLASSDAVLEDVRAVLAVNPQIRQIRIEGHTDDRGRDRHNAELSARRALSVMRWLRDHGVIGNRLTGAGCGESHPVTPNETAAGRQTNRRVEFHVVDPVPPSGARHIEGCVDIALY